MSGSFNDTKKHYLILDGLRGIAAILVVAFHILETFSEGDHVRQVINHGYLAVDFFFVLSGFVIGYAYDDRWNTLSIGAFIKRRLIRLHPMIIMGMVIGAVTFYFQDSPMFPDIHSVPLYQLILLTLIGCTLLPVPPAMDIRGWQEMHPLDGPAWSLFFEYVANLLYAFLLRKLPTILLGTLTIIAGAALVHLALTDGQGDIIGGWSLEPRQFRIGATRLMYPFLAGLLLARLIRPGHFTGAFLWCSVLLIIILAFPRLGGYEHLWMNALYDSGCIIFLFPLIVYLGASGSISGRAAKICRFLGDISYPIYIIHYPFMYLFMAWVSRNNIQIDSPETIAAATLLFMVTLALAYWCVKYYDEPVRNWLSRKLLSKEKG